MKAVLLTAPNSPLLVVDDHPEPVADGGQIIEVTACGVCHSDIHVVDGDFGSSLPMILGHEVTGVHPDLGPVMLYAPWGCGACQQCHQGLEMMCTDAREAGLFTDGGYAERMRVPAMRYLAPLGDLDPIAAAPLACGGLTAYRAVSHALPTLRERGADARVLVIGAGGLGQYALRYLRLLTDAHVVALDISADKRETAIDVGAHHAVGPDDHLDACDVVLDFIAAETTLTAAAGHVAKQGMVIAIGLGGGRVPFGFGAVPHEAHFLSSVWGSRRELDDLLTLARAEPSIVQPVEAVPLHQAQTAHDRLRAGDVKGRLVLTT